MSKFFRSIAPAVALGGAAIAIVAVLDPAIARQGEEDSALASGAMPLATQEPSPELSAPQTVPQADVQAQVTESAAPQASPEATTAREVKKKKKKKPATSSKSDSNSSATSTKDATTAQAPAVEPAPNVAANQGSSSNSSSSTSCDNAKDVTGASAMTPWGPVQVVASVAGGKICSAHAIAYPNRDRKSAMINAYAIPYLDQAATAQGVQFDGVSGATYTTNAYRRSLQSVLDR